MIDGYEQTRDVLDNALRVGYRLFGKYFFWVLVLVVYVLAFLKGIFVFKELHPIEIVGRKKLYIF